LLLADVVDLLQCPVCGGALDCGAGVVQCRAGHSFDIARQGYVNLVPGRADTPEMVEARDAFLRAGHFRPLSEALAEEARAAAAVVGAAEGGAAEGGAAEGGAAEGGAAEGGAAEGGAAEGGAAEG